jgi:hypothetical protein
MGSYSLHLLLDSLCQDAVGKVHLEEISDWLMLEITKNAYNSAGKKREKPLITLWTQKCERSYTDKKEN